MKKKTGSPLVHPNIYKHVANKNIIIRALMGLDNRLLVRYV